MTARHRSPRPLTTLGLVRAEVTGSPSRRVLRALLVVLGLLAGAFVVGVPRQMSTVADRALGETLAAQPDGMRDIGLRLVRDRQYLFGSAELANEPLEQPASPFAEVDGTARALLGPAVLDHLAGVDIAAQTEPFTIIAVDQRARVGPRVVLRIQQDLDRRVRWVTGTPPGAPTQRVAIPVEGVDGGAPATRRVEVIPVGLAAPTARTWGLTVGDRLDLQTAMTGRVPDKPAVVELVGTFEPLDPADPFWRAEAQMLGIASVATADGGEADQAALLAAPNSYSALGQTLQPQPVFFAEGQALPSPAFQHSWRYRLNESALTAAEVPALRAAIARLGTATTWGKAVPQMVTGLPGVLDRYAADQAATATLVATTAASTVLLAGLASLAVLAVLLRARRRDLALVVRRGASPRVLTTVAGADAVHWLWPGLALGVLLGHLVPGVTPGWVWVAAASPALAATLIARVAASRELAADADAPHRRRVERLRSLGLDALVVVAAVLVVAQVRERGLAGAITGGVDPVAAIATGLAAVATALVVRRLLPPLLALAARAARRGRGAIGVLGLAGARAAAAAAGPPVVVVVVGSALAALLLSLGTAALHQRSDAAWREVGADLVVRADRVDPAEAEAAAHADGVRLAVAALTRTDALAATAARTTRVDVLALPADRLDVLWGDTPLAVASGTPAALTASGSTAKRLPVVASAPLPGGSSAVLRASGLEVDIDVTAVDPSLTRLRGGAPVTVLLVDLAALRRQAALATDTLYVRGDGTPPTLPLERSRVGRVEVLDRVAGLATSRLVLMALVTSGALAALLGALGVLLLVAASRPALRALQARLAVLGSPRASRGRLALVQTMPLLTAAAVVGASIGTLLPGLLGPVIELSPVTGAPAGTPVPAAWPWSLAVAASVLLLGLVLVLTDAARDPGPLAARLRDGEGEYGS